MIERITHLKIGQKLMICFLALGVLPALIIGLSSLEEASEGLESLAFNQLEAVREIKKAQLEQYVDDRESDLKALTEVAGTLRQVALEKLNAIREVKKRSIQTYFKSVEVQAQTLSGSQTVHGLVTDLDGLFSGYNQVGAGQVASYRNSLNGYYTDRVAMTYETINEGKTFDGVDQVVPGLDDVSVALQHYYFVGAGSTGKATAGGPYGYADAHNKAHSTILGYQRKFGLANIHVIDAKSGRIAYSASKKLDFGTSLTSGPYADSQLAEVFNKAKEAASADAVFISDFATYTPNYDSPALFVASPIMDGDSVIGVLALQVNINTLNLMMAERTGLGNSGEIYLVGQDHLMRSDSNFEPRLTAEMSLKNPESGKADSVAIANALAGDEGSGVIESYLGKPVLSSWGPLRVGDNSWGLVADIDVTEALSPIDENWMPFYQKYTEIYGYEDLLLVNPDGFVFFTSANGEENRTNLINGPYKDTHLGAVVRKTIANKAVSFADFKPYSASKNAPAAFLAQPFIHNDKVEMVIVLRLSKGGFNSIMSIKDGMGESGDSYLVGPDKLMRSDSLGDPENRTVAASFAGNVANNGVDTASVAKALAGESATVLSTNYAGRSVLAAYSPLQLGGTTWALVAEVDESEAFASARALQIMTFSVLLASVIIIVIVGIILARRISRPLAEASRVAGLVSAGDLTTDIQVTSHDEIGDLQAALRTMNEGLREMVSQISQSADMQSSAAEQLSIITTQTREHLREQNTSTDMVATAITEMSSTVQEVSRNTTDAAESAKDAIKEVQSGNREVQSVIDSIHTFAAEIDSMATILKGVEEGAENIGGIVDVINGIADQTNLLALNAAIEAARAGDQGRGFAVVADEVRSLAQSTQNSTKQIADMIHKLQDGARASAQAMSRGKEQMNKVVTQAESTGEALTRINQRVDQITDMNLQIASATEEQSAVAEDINKNITQISELSQRTGTDADEIAAASNQLSELAADLQVHTGRFKM